MGSMDKAVITGFICRLCSKMNRFVIHIYGEEGERMKLAEKINAYLPITVKVNDPLPKTACLHCIERLEAHHELMEKILFSRKRLGIEPDVNQAPSSQSSSLSSQSLGVTSTESPAAPPPASTQQTQLNSPPC
ncbi:uncharacterized protein LOC130675349 [Microplitis mediator]|uniref:uncharacterized protein LOC130675349 n=1 Tax=Microplitis mediator TaxID=375433 RepID=UPI002555095E|nr:uncharacterized protein LOC130675349 [Microplitis mediator]XP_057336948.1 uncharacterized protein LOC130675349 [Microplitis mediator]